jgi:hypothetical protein
MRADVPTSDFIIKLKFQTLSLESQQSSPQLSRATTSEITELISLGNSQLKISPDRITVENLKQARHYFSKALHFLKNQSHPAASPKQVSRVCQKLMETSLGLSMRTHGTERKEHADQAHKYGEAALDNGVRSGDECMIAQLQFLLLCVTAWKMYSQARVSGNDPRSHPGIERVELLMAERLNELSKFQNLDMEVYEAQARKYLGYLTTSSQTSGWD